MEKLMQAEVPSPRITRGSFPKNFKFGAATSAYQVEGASQEGGRGPGIWDTFSCISEGSLRHGAVVNAEGIAYYNNLIYKLLKNVVKKEEELINGREVRASNISFLGEKVMQEEKTFTTEYLNQVLTGHDLTDVHQSLLREVKYTLEFSWHCSVPRWEARNFI